jgi:hypothetical protein
MEYLLNSTFGQLANIANTVGDDLEFSTTPPRHLVPPLLPSLPQPQPQPRNRN